MFPCAIIAALLVRLCDQARNAGRPSGLLPVLWTGEWLPPAPAIIRPATADFLLTPAYWPADPRDRVLFRDLRDAGRFSPDQIREAAAIWKVKGAIVLFAPVFFLNGASPRIFTISPAVSGKTTWDLDVDGPLTLTTAGTWTLTPSGGFSGVIELNGGGGGAGAAVAANNGNAGVASTFPGLSAGGGARSVGAAASTSGAGGAGGTATGGDTNTNGSAGGTGSSGSTSTGGSGGASPNGGASRAGRVSSAVANTGGFAGNAPGGGGSGGAQGGPQANSRYAAGGAGGGATCLKAMPPEFYPERKLWWLGRVGWATRTTCQAAMGPQEERSSHDTRTHPP